MRHRLALPLFISILIHACLLASMPNLWKSKGAHSNTLHVFQAKLRLLAELPAAVAEPRHDVVKDAPTQPLVAKPVQNKPESRQVAQPMPDKALAPVEMQRPPPLANATPPRLEEPSLLPGPPAPQEATPRILNSVAPQPDQEALDGYGRALSKAFSRFQRYPPLAQIRRWEGKVQVSLQIAAGGKLVSASVSQSSGYEILDQQALEIIKQANPLPQVPEALQAKTFTVVVPILFKLENS